MISVNAEGMSIYTDYFIINGTDFLIADYVECLIDCCFRFIDESMFFFAGYKIAISLITTINKSFRDPFYPIIPGHFFQNTACLSVYHKWLGPIFHKPDHYFRYFFPVMSIVIQCSV